MNGSRLTSRPVVVLDPGHGGSAVNGGSSPNNATGYNGLLEKNLTLDVANAARRNLASHADVRLTRTGDVNLGLAARAQVARDANASVFVSVHFNGAVHADGSINPTVNGSEAFVAAAGNRDRELLAQAVLDRVCHIASTRNRGVQTRELGTILGSRHAPHTAATLVELSFLTNRAEADRLANATYREDLGRAVATGVRDYLARMSHAAAYEGAFADAGGWQEPMAEPFDSIIARDDFVECPLLASHARGVNLGMRWNAMPALPPAVDVVLHLHGFVNRRSRYDVRQKTQVSGLNLQRRVRPTLALMPIGQPGVVRGDNLTYEPPALYARRGQGANDIIRWAVDRWTRDRSGRSSGTVNIGRRIYSAHSGGGARLLNLLGYGHDPDELHLFDCFYEDPARAIAWMQRHVRADRDRLNGRPRNEWTSIMAASGGALRLVITGVDRRDRPNRRGTWPMSSQVARALRDVLREVPDESRRSFLASYYRVEAVSYIDTPPNDRFEPPHGRIPEAYGGQLLQDASNDLTPVVSQVRAPVNGTAQPQPARSHGVAMYTGGSVADPYSDALQAANPTLPARPANAAGGAAVLQPFAGDRSPAGAAWVARENAMVDEIVRGNFPQQLRRWVDVPVEFTERSGTVHRGVIRVMPDLLAVGSDSDYVITPLDAISAQRVADAFGCVLPTAKMVHDVYRAADIKHVAIPRDYWRTAPHKQSSTNAYLEHDRAIKTRFEQWLSRTPAALSQSLHEGHKKQVIIAAGLQNANLARRLAFYGWYGADGRPIQSGGIGRAAYAHEPGYADYSHGVRLVHPWMTVDGSPRRVAEVLADPVLHRLLSNEGAITRPRIPATR